MTPTLILAGLGNFCWAYAIVLAIAWFRAVGQRDLRKHVGHFVELMGSFIPGIALVFAIMMIGTALQMGWIIGLIIMLFPGSLVVGLHLEVARLNDYDQQIDNRRMAITVCLALANAQLTFRRVLDADPVRP